MRRSEESHANELRQRIQALESQIIEYNKSLIEAYSEISKLNFETLKMRQKMKTEINMSEEEISAIFPLLEYPPKPSWG